MKTTFQVRIEATRKKGRPPNALTTNVTRASNMKVQELSRLCEDRVRWRKAVQSVSVCAAPTTEHRYQLKQVRYTRKGVPFVVVAILLVLTCEESQYHRSRCLSISAPLSTTRSDEGCKDKWSFSSWLVGSVQAPTNQPRT